MSWQVEWMDAGIRADRMHHQQFGTSEAAVRFADDCIRQGCRVFRINGPRGEVWDESRVRIAVSALKLG